jgi:hypothetical protein
MSLKIQSNSDFHSYIRKHVIILYYANHNDTNLDILPKISIEAIIVHRSNSIAKKMVAVKMWVWLRV